jgi:hypothetical protein
VLVQVTDLLHSYRQFCVPATTTTGSSSCNKTTLSTLAAPAGSTACATAAVPTMPCLALAACTDAVPLLPCVCCCWPCRWRAQA